MVIRYKQERRDVFAAARVVNGKVAIWLAIWWIVVTLAVTFPMLTAVAKHQQSLLATLAQNAYSLVMLVCVGIAFIALRFVGLWLGARKAILREIEWSLEEEGVQIRSDVAESRILWPAFLKFKETDKVFLLYVQKNMAQFIPKRILSASQTQELSDLIRRHVKPA